MSHAFFCFLPDRGVIRVTGADAAHLLDGLITNAIAKLDRQAAIHTGLLSPKGKILFDFFLVRDGDTYLIEVARTQIEDLIKRLTFYRLRAKVAFEDVSDALRVGAIWGGEAKLPDGDVVFADPRHTELGCRFVQADDANAEPEAEATTEAAYHAHRIALGVPEAGSDYALGDAFPHEALYDVLGSADFSKGCFVGQEIVSRMHHLGTPRSRIVPIQGEAALTAGSDIHAGNQKIGQVGSVAGARGMALVRLDRAAQAEAPLTTDGGAISLDNLAWANLDMTTGALRRAEKKA